MSFITIDDVVAALAAGQLKSFWFPSVVTVAGRLTDLNSAGVGRYGQAPVPAVRGSSGTLHADSDVGYPWFTNASGGAELRLLQMSPVLQTAGAISVYERVWSCSGMSGTVTTPQAITSFPSLTIPDVNGTGLELFAEIYSTIGTSGTTITASYTNSANTSGRSTLAQPIGATGLREVYRLIPLPLQGTDAGVKAIASATIAATTGTAGDFGLVLARRLGTWTSPAQFSLAAEDFAGCAMPLVNPDAALMFALLASTTSSGLVDGSMILGAN